MPELNENCWEEEANMKQKRRRKGTIGQKTAKVKESRADDKTSSRHTVEQQWQLVKYFFGGVLQFQ